MTLRVLSIRQPWAWAIFHAGKDIENRGWMTDYRGTIAIQAGKNPAPGAREKLHAMGIDVPDSLPTCVVLGVVDLADIVKESASRWAVDDHWHWQFTNPRPLDDPVPLLGRQSLFRAPADVEQAVMAQL
ncbi:hypothetical protein GR925_22270 [Streptomyces sp. HUCO-GS316]|uniref:ASCH domain-containing protein n=1 Tax=Streptomyces sp. HUCO-GS316 TaxID=2692198 RepID=UPI00140023A0|nr:ASCH domain-containing protein [Streptomyces sp. HUCO-GS316]MXM66099.1 hypothetical protein [Streptomyces sp. HUCO-GS316]